jgi:phosphoenolpyruvate synthase/pyruvate phosphate dikinase
MTMLVVPFAHEQCRDPSVAGGKGANLAVLSAAGLPVPPGFCVTTEAYRIFSDAIGLDQLVREMLAGLRDDAEDLERVTSELRAFITSAAVPHPIVEALFAAYEALGRASYVAVRSSGTAEDLAGASFAGLHDTYLDIHGTEALLSSLKRCWASMWTARATSYRRTKGFDQNAARIAVVVQQMVEAEVAGVMFTANPLTGATDEIVLNAAYGLGEALVSGIATPDEHVISIATLKVKEQRIGAKEVRVIRDANRGSGTVTEPVPEGARAGFALSPAQVAELGELGRRVMALYAGVPQDCEWAIKRGRLYLLQARPVTGIEFSWDEELESWQTLPDDEGALWTRSWADEVWNGAISPLTYSYRGYMFTESARNCARLIGLKGVPKTRMYKFHRSEAYLNTAVEEAFVAHSAPGERQARVGQVPIHAPSHGVCGLRTFQMVPDSGKLPSKPD